MRARDGRHAGGGRRVRRRDERAGCRPDGDEARRRRPVRRPAHRAGRRHAVRRMGPDRAGPRADHRDVALGGGPLRTGGRERAGHPHDPSQRRPGRDGRVRAGHGAGRRWSAHRDGHPGHARPAPASTAAGGSCTATPTSRRPTPELPERRPVVDTRFAAIPFDPFAAEALADPYPQFAHLVEHQPVSLVRRPRLLGGGAPRRRPTGPARLPTRSRRPTRWRRSARSARRPGRCSPTVGSGRSRR